MNRPLTADQTVRALELLDVIVKPGSHDFIKEIREAQALLGYPVWEPARSPKTRSFYGIKKLTK